MSTPIPLDLSAACGPSGDEGLTVCRVWHGWAISPCRSIPPVQNTLHSVTWSNEAFPSRALPGGNSTLSRTVAVTGMGLQYYRCAGDKG